MGILGKLFHFLSTEDEPPRRSAAKSSTANAGCVLCKHWVKPSAITTKVVPSQRAVDWAKSNGFGRCTAPANDEVDRKRFTKETDGCDQHEMRAAGGK